MVNIRLLLAVAAAGGFGTALRFLLSRWAEASFAGQFPLGTLLVNVLGCTAMGAVMAWPAASPHFNAWRPVIAAGVLGGLTTFSAYTAEIGTSIQRGQFGTAALLLLLHNALGLCGLFLGYCMMSWSSSVR